MRDKADFVVRIELLDLLDSHLLLFDSQSRNKDFSIYLQEVDVGPVFFEVLVGALTQFLYGKMLKQGGFDFLPQLGVEIGIVVH